MTKITRLENQSERLRRLMRLRNDPANFKRLQDYYRRLDAWAREQFEQRNRRSA